MVLLTAKGGMQIQEGTEVKTQGGEGLSCSTAVASIFDSSVARPSIAANGNLIALP